MVGNNHNEQTVETTEEFSLVSPSEITFEEPCDYDSPLVVKPLEELKASFEDKKIKIFPDEQMMLNREANLYFNKLWLYNRQKSFTLGRRRSSWMDLITNNKVQEDEKNTFFLLNEGDIKVKTMIEGLEKLDISQSDIVAKKTTQLEQQEQEDTPKVDNKKSLVESQERSVTTNEKKKESMTSVDYSSTTLNEKMSKVCNSLRSEASFRNSRYVNEKYSLEEVKEKLSDTEISFKNCNYDEALSSLKSIIKATSKDQSCNNPSLALMYYNLAVLYYKNSRISRAKRAFHESLSKHNLCEIHEMNHENIARNFFHVGLIQVKYKNFRNSTQAMNESHQALNDLWKMRESQQEQKNEEHSELSMFAAKVHNNLAVTYAIRKRYKGAKKHFEAALEINRALVENLKMQEMLSDETLGKDHAHSLAINELEVASNLCNYVTMLCDYVDDNLTVEKEEDWDVMMDYLKEAQKIRHGYMGKYFGKFDELIQMRKLEQKVNQALSYRGKSDVKSDEKDTKKKEEDEFNVVDNYCLSEENLTIVPIKLPDEEMVPPDASSSEKTNSQLVSEFNSSALAANKVEEEREQERKMMEEQRKKEDREKIGGKLKESLSLYKSGKDNAALRLYNITLQEVQEKYGENAIVAMISYNIGSIQIHQKNHREAISAFKTSMRIHTMINNLDRDHIDVATSYARIGMVHLLQKNYEIAHHILEEVLAMRIKLLGRFHPDTARIYNNIGSALFQSGKLEKALESYYEAICIQRAVLLSINTDDKNLKLEASITLMNIGNLCKAKKVWFKAESMYREGFNLQYDVLGSTHPFVLNTIAFITETAAKR